MQNLPTHTRREVCLLPYEDSLYFICVIFRESVFPFAVIVYT
jgi:hypothetical protein